MANEIWTSFDSGKILYALIRRVSDKYIYCVSNTTFEVVGTWNDARLTQCDIPLTESNGQLYLADFPTADTPPAWAQNTVYALDVRVTATLPAWANSTAYVVNDIVTSGTSHYVCITAHTSLVAPGVFATDVAYWREIENVFSCSTAHTSTVAGTFDDDWSHAGGKWTYSEATTAEDTYYVTIFEQMAAAPHITNDRTLVQGMALWDGEQITEITDISNSAGMRLSVYDDRDPDDIDPNIGDVGRI